jgi:hypothetical protein
MDSIRKDWSSGKTMALGCGSKVMSTLSPSMAEANAFDSMYKMLMSFMHTIECADSDHSVFKEGSEEMSV